MARKLLTVEDFRSSAKEGDAPDAMVVCASTGTAEPVANSRRVKFVFSDGLVDRSGDMIDPKGWVLDRFQKNPVALFGHDSSNVDSVIGRAVNVGASGGKLIGEIEFAEAEINPKADMAFRMVEAGILSAVSVGFMPLEFSFTSDKNRPYGIDFSKQELLEISLVPVPCNANALIQAKGLGIDTGPLEEWIERILDNEGMVSVPRKLLEETFRAAKTSRRIRRQYLVPSSRGDASEWHVGASRGLPIDVSDAWDGAAAASRIFAAAGFDGDNPDSSQARKGFLIYDASNPALKASYKLPFADIIGGEMKAVAGGIRAAASRLSTTDTPGAVLEDACKIIDSYESKMNPDKQTSRDMARALVKDMYDISLLAGLIEGLASLETWVEWETEYEGDESDIADRLVAVLQTLAQILIDMTTEEVSELLANKSAMEITANQTSGQKVILGLAKIMKAGRKISAANEALLTKAMDHHQSATDCIKSVMSSGDMMGEDPGGLPSMEPAVHDPVEMSVDNAERERRIRRAKALKLVADLAS